MAFLFAQNAEHIFCAPINLHGGVAEVLQRPEIGVSTQLGAM